MVVGGRIRNSPSIRRARGAQRGPGISTRLRAYFSPKQIRDWGRVQAGGGLSKERREHESRQVEMHTVWRDAV